MTTSSTATNADVTGPRRGRLGYVVIGIVAAVCAGGWAFVMAHVGQTPGISQQTIAFTVQSDSAVRITYSVAKPENATVRCTVDAVDTNFAPVAAEQITIPPGVAKVTRTETLRTSARANAARVKDCREQ